MHHAEWLEAWLKGNGVGRRGERFVAFPDERFSVRDDVDLSHSQAGFRRSIGHLQNHHLREGGVRKGIRRREERRKENVTTEKEEEVNIEMEKKGQSRASIFTTRGRVS